MKREYPYKEHIIIVDAYESPPDGWRYNVVLRSPGVAEGIPLLPEPSTVAKTQEEAYQAGLESGKAVVDRL